MTFWYYANLSVHVLVAMLWLGGMFFLGAVGAPVLRTVEPAAMRQRLFQELGLRFRTVGWWSIAVLVGTGVINLHFRGWLTWDGALGSSAFWGTGAGIALAIKLVAVTLMVGVSWIHDFVLGPRASMAAAGTGSAIALRRRAMLVARANALLGVILVAAALRLARG